MTRLIDADDIVLDYSGLAYIPPLDFRGVAEEFAKQIDAMPTIDAVPVRHGKWIRTGRTNVYGGYELECSECGDRLMAQHIERELYCRNCGARMDEE